MRQSSWQIVNWLLGVSLAVLCFHTWAASSQAAEQLIDEEVVRKWKEYDRFSRSLQGMARKTIVRDSGKEEQSEIVYKQNPNCVCRCIWDKQKPSEYCEFANAQYAASLTRDKSNPGEVVLERFTEDPQGAFPGTNQSLFGWSFPDISPHFCIGSTPLSRILTDQRFKILKLSKVSEKGRELVRLDFKVGRDDPKSGMRSESFGWSVLDPSRCWCVLRSKGSNKITIKGTHTMDTEAEIEFETIDHPSGFPLLKTKTSHGSRQTYRGKNEKHTLRSRIDYEWEVNASVPDSEFTLSAFGLPEPGSDEPVKKPVPMYVWILVAASVCAALALGFRYLAHRRTRTQPTA